MKNNYVNEFLGLSKSVISEKRHKIHKEILALDPLEDIDKIAELQNQADKLVEAYYAIDCGSYWEVNSARVPSNGKPMKYKINK